MRTTPHLVDCHDGGGHDCGHDGGHDGHADSGDHDGEGGEEGGPVEPPLFCNPLTGSQADEHPGHGQHDGSGEEEDAQQVRHPPALLLFSLLFSF